MAIDHAPYAEAVRLQVLGELTIVGQACLDLETLGVGQRPDLLLVASDASVDLLVDVAVWVATSVDLLYRR